MKKLRFFGKLKRLLLLVFVMMFHALNAQVTNNTLIKSSSDFFSQQQNNIRESLSDRRNFLQNESLADVTHHEHQKFAQNGLSPLEQMKRKTEDLSKRDAFSKHFINTDGSYTAVIAAAPQHFQKNGKWEEISTSIKRETSGNYHYSNKDNLMESWFGATASQGIMSKTKEGEVKEFINTKMYWEVKGQKIGEVSGADVAAKVDGDKLFYNNIFGNIDAEYTVLVAKRKLNYIIPDKSALGKVPANADYLVFSEEIELPKGWSYEKNEKGIYIFNNNKEIIYLFENPVSTDSGNKQDELSNTIFDIKQSGNFLIFETKVKALWLINDFRIFPVMVDPTVIVYPTAVGNYNTGSIDNQGNKTANNDIYVGMRFAYGQATGTRRFMRGWSSFDMTSIPVGSTITGTTFGLYIGLNSLNNTYGQFIRVGQITSGIPNASTGATLYNMCAEAGTNNWINIPAGLTGNATVALNAAQMTALEGSLSAGIFSFGFYPDGSYSINATEQVGIFGSTRPQATSNGRPYLTITYDAPASCYAPSNPTISAITQNSATLNWTAASPAPALGYAYYYNTTGTAPVAATGPSGTTGAGVTTANLTGLATNTVYHVWVRSTCTTSSNSVWTYGGYFNTTPPPCFQGDGQVRGAVVNGLNVSAANYSVADDFIVPAGEAFSINHISLEAMSTASPNRVTIKVRADNGGVPGAVLNTIWNNAAPTSSVQYTTAFGMNAYHLKFNLATAVPLAAGAYWLEVTMANSGGSVVFWRSTDTGTTGQASMQSTNGGNTWSVYDPSYDQVFYVAGNCVTCTGVTATATKNIVCAGQSTTLTASAGSGYTYTWYSDYDGQTDTGTQIGTGASINVSPTASNAYWVVATHPSGCKSNTYIMIAVSSPPSLVVLDPIAAVTCAGEIAELKVANGGEIGPIMFNETFDPIANPWITSAAGTTTGPGAPDFWWRLYTYGGNNSALINSESYGAYELQSSLISPPVSVLDHSGPVTLTFDHYFRQKTATSSIGYLEISTEGGAWTTIATYTATEGALAAFANKSYNLDTYIAGKTFFQIRFRYVANNAYYWLVDNVKVTGTPKSTEITWSPTTGLYSNATGTVPYAGENTSVVYASPTVTTTYTASAKTAVGCPANATVTVEKGDTQWSSISNSNWNIAANWNGNKVPTADHCVNIPNTAFKPIIDVATNAVAKNLTIAAGGGLTIQGGGSLTVTDFIKNNGIADNLVVESDGNLIQVKSDADNSGSIVAKRNVTDMDNVLATQMDYVYWSSPVTGQGLQAFSPGTPINRIYQYNEWNDYFSPVNLATEPNFIRGKGYAIRAEDGYANGYNKTYSFTGAPNNGDISINIKRSADTGTPAAPVVHGYNLVGNPYPSNINFDILYDNNAALIYKTAWFWTNSTYQMYMNGSNYSGNNYAVYNGTGGNSASYTSGTVAPNGIVKVGQGFIVQVRKPVGTNEALHFKNSWGSNPLRTTISGTFYQRNETQKDRYWLKLIAPDSLVNSQLIGYIPGATNGFEKDFDAEAFSLSSDLFYSKLEDKDLLIQGRGTFVDTDKVILGANFFRNGSYTIELENPEGIFGDSQAIYLKDNELGTYTNLQEGGYQFMATAGMSEGRFEIVYVPETVLSTGNTNTSQLLVYRDGGDFVVRSAEKNISEIEVYDASGRLILKKAGKNREVRIGAESMVSGMYVLKATLENGEVHHRKIRK